MPAVSSTPKVKKSRWWLWLLLLLLLGGLAWWFYFYPAPIKAEAVAPVKIEIAKPEQKPELPKEEPKNEPVKEEPQIEPVKEKIEEEKKTPKPRIDNSIAEKVRASGGNPNGDFRASLVWHNGEDLDLQLNTLNAHANKCSNGYAVLDVDMNGVGCGSNKRNFTSPV